MTSPGDPERRKGTALRSRRFFSRGKILGFKDSRVQVYRPKRSRKSEDEKMRK
jgi:hypothetical protein